MESFPPYWSPLCQLRVYVWDLCNAHTLTHFHGCLDHTHLSFHPLSAPFPGPANALVALPECTGRRVHFLLSALAALGSADASHWAHVCFFWVQLSLFHGRGLAVGWWWVFFFPHSSNGKMFCAQHIWESKQMKRKNIHTIHSFSLSTLWKTFVADTQKIA